MAFHIAFARPTDLAAIEAGAARGEQPHHAIAALADTLGATVQDGAGLRPSALDRLLGKASGTPPLAWAIARGVRRTVAPGDVVYCTGEDIGLPVAALCGGRARVAISVHNVDRPRSRALLRLIGGRVALYLSVAAPQIAFLRRFLGLSEDGARFMFDQTDRAFFAPGPRVGGTPRPMVMSVGLEQRDYRTLAEATAALDIDVRISGFSRDATALARAFPPALPANMDRRFYTWPDLRQLYRDADLVVVSLFPASYAAGVQVLMEAMACGTPVIATRTEGLAAYLDRPDAVTIVAPGDAAALRGAIEALLGDPARAAAQADAATALAAERHDSNAHVAALAAALRALA